MLFISIKEKEEQVGWSKWKIIFMDYSSQWKGYMAFILKTNKQSIRKYVIFYEKYFLWN